MASRPARSPGCCTRNPRDSETPCAGLAPRTSGDDAHRRTHSTDSSGRANSIGRSSSWRDFCTMRNSGSSVRSAHGSESAGSKIDGTPRPSCGSMRAVCHGSSSPWQRNAQRSPSGTNSVENADRIRRGNRKLIRARSLRLRRRSAWMADTFTVQEKPLRRFCEQVLAKLGVPAEDARVTTDVLVLADLRGIDSHGVARLGRYVNGLKQGTMKATDQSRVIREAKATALVDGGQSLGQVVGKKAMDLAIRKARDTAVGVVAVRNSNHYGIAGYYSLMALEHDLIGVSMTNAGPLVVPTFGRTAILGTNPISLAAPAMKEKAFVLDMATSTVPRGKVEVYNRLGQPMPHGWAVDETGRSSTDPARVLNALAKRLGGGLLPLGGEGEELGGHKGYGLALMVDVLCGVLSGAATGLQVYADEKKPNVGHFFMALDPTAFRPLDEFRRDMDRLARELKDSPKAQGQERIYVHGEKSFARMEKFRKEGIPLDSKVVDGLKKIGADLGIPWPA